MTWKVENFSIAKRSSSNEIRTHNHELGLTVCYLSPITIISWSFILSSYIGTLTLMKKYLVRQTKFEILISYSL